MESGAEKKLVRWFRRQLMPSKKVMPSQEIRDYISEKFRELQTAQADDYMQEMVPAPEYCEEPLSDESFFGESAPCSPGVSGWDDGYCSCSPRPSEYREEPKAAADTSSYYKPGKETSARPEASADIDRLIRQKDESFQQMLFREIDNRKLTDVECYRRAHVDRRTFSKIRGDVQYKPKKTTAVSFALALRLSVGETEDLLKKAGYSFIDNNIFDIIIRYYMEKKRYDIIEINETLFYYDQPLLGTQ